MKKTFTKLFAAAMLLASPAIVQQAQAITLEASVNCIAAGGSVTIKMYDFGESGNYTLFRSLAFGPEATGFANANDTVIYTTTNRGVFYAQFEGDPSGTLSFSNQVTVSLFNPANAVSTGITVNEIIGNTICWGTQIDAFINITNGGANPTTTWFMNGALMTPTTGDGAYLSDNNGVAPLYLGGNLQIMAVTTSDDACQSVDTAIFDFTERVGPSVMPSDLQIDNRTSEGFRIKFKRGNGKGTLVMVSTQGTGNLGCDNQYNDISESFITGTRGYIDYTDAAIVPYDNFSNVKVVARCLTGTIGDSLPVYTGQSYPRNIILSHPSGI